MCVVSNIGDGFQNEFPKKWPDYFPPSTGTGFIHINPVTREEFDKLKSDLAAMRKEVEDLKLALIEAKNQDAADGNPDCEMESKIKFLKQVSEALGVDLSQVFQK